ncbi:hypothetical protein N7467_006092 [Penicillium canescens]|nr:hypothetical protein N7467_006092 [Penicillium canescens]
MTNPETIHFFDLWSDFPGADKSWSPNTLKTRMVLNYKGIPYTQSWVSYPDIAPLLKSMDVPPHKISMPYTLPAITHKGAIKANPEGALMDSDAIATYLDKLYPSPPLFPSGDASYAILIAVRKIVALISPSMRSLIIPNVVGHLDPRGQEYFERTRAELFGKPLAEVRPKDEESLVALWDIIEKESEPLIKMLKGRQGKKGPFLEGERPGYADFSLACILAFFNRFDRDVFDKILVLGGGEFKALYEACLPWLEGQGEEREWPIPQ